MAVKIRLKRMGAKQRPFYRVVVADARSPRDGRFIESVGYYDPLKNPKVFHVDGDRIKHWMATGAKPSEAVRELLERQGALPATAHPVRTKTGPKRAPKAGAATARTAAAPAVAEEVPAEPEPVDGDLAAEAAPVAEDADQPVAEAAEAGTGSEPAEPAGDQEPEGTVDGDGAGDAPDPTPPEAPDGEG
ncbi:MAG TPA: 30S ribosomal protein S16 [Candidatus Dormibacteraeota bacterium]